MIADENHDESDENGVGDSLLEGLDDPHRARSTLKMIEQAIKHRWEIPPKVFAALPAHIGRIALNMAEGSNKVNSGVIEIRHQIPAARVVVLMNGQNQSADKPEESHNHLHLHGKYEDADDQDILAARKALSKLNGQNGEADR